MEIIATIYTEFEQKFGIPRQSGIADALEGKIVFEKPFRTPQAVRGLEGFSHLWLIWGFSANEPKPFAPTVRPPRLGGNTRVGVFASRSPFRPNGLGLSSLKIKKIDCSDKEGPVIYVSGADLMSGTPIYDIKPYVREDCHPDADFGFTDKVPFQTVSVHLPERLREQLGEKATALVQVLENRPIPAYQNDPGRIYAMSFAGSEVRFRLSGDSLEVLSIENS